MTSLAVILEKTFNASIELAKSGMAQVVIYQHKKPFIYQDRLLKLQEEAKKKHLGMWAD